MSVNNFCSTFFVCTLDNIFQPVVLQQAEPAEMDRLGEAAEKAAGQVRAGAHRLLWSRVLYTQRRPTATGDHKVMFHQVTRGVLCESIRRGRRGVTWCPLRRMQAWNDGMTFDELPTVGRNEVESTWFVIDVLSCSDFQLFPPAQNKAITSVLLLHSQVIVSVHRYQYYLQLKKDVLEGRITCSLEQAIHLASLAVQGNTSMLLLLFLLHNAGKAELSVWRASCCPLAAKLKIFVFKAVEKDFPVQFSQMGPVINPIPAISLIYVSSNTSSMLTC